MNEPDPLSGLPGSRHDRPPNGLLLIGHSWTTTRVARHLGIGTTAVADHPHLLRLNGPLCYEPAYPALQFDQTGVRLDVAVVALLARRRVPPDEVCDWLVRANPALGGAPPLVWLDASGSVQAVLEALPPPSGMLPGGVPADDGAPAQVAAWIRRTEGAGGSRPVSWREIRDGAADAGPDVRRILGSLRRGREAARPGVASPG